MANRLIGKRIRAAAVNFAPTLAYFRNAEVTGIPVRADFFGLAPRSPECPPHLLVMGGSQGARALNQRMPEIAKALLDAVPGLTILHQAGARHAETTEAAYVATGAAPDRWKVQAFLEDMPKQFAQSDLILARSGASTVAELAASGKPSLLVPFPYAADDHQRRNAEVLVEGGAATMLLEQDMTEPALLQALTSLLQDREKLAYMSTSARAFAHPRAAARIAELAAGLAG
jgi:UDP-N-acetylglucosamine--N-acetylmuramyl-(pentapeptide) pyrophosphoryl-undecaprenol N-acetylglucosamine transferase